MTRLSHSSPALCFDDVIAHPAHSRSSARLYFHHLSYFLLPLFFSYKGNLIVFNTKFAKLVCFTRQVTISTNNRSSGK